MPEDITDQHRNTTPVDDAQLKSEERVRVEHEIWEAFTASEETAMRMLNEEYGGDMQAAERDADFVDRVHSTIRDHWHEYVNGHKRLEELERIEGYPATRECARVLDEVASCIPPESRQVCHYPFSGIDVYWARIFDRTVMEDIAFGREEMQNMWWDAERYTPHKREQIVSELKGEGVIPGHSDIDFVQGDAEMGEHAVSGCETTLLVKGGHDFLGYVGSKELDYGAIVTANVANPRKDVEERLEADGYVRDASLHGTDFLLPYGMWLRDIDIFVRRE